MNQKPRVPKNKKAGSKPVITRYAPPPGYVPPQPGASAVPPPPPPPPPPPVSAPPYSQHSVYPQHAAQQYAATTPTTPQAWAASPQSYTAPAHQWPQAPVTPTGYAPQQLQQPQAAQPAQAQSGYNAYGQPISPYPAQQSPAQAYPPPVTYPTPHMQSAHPSYPPYGAQQPQQVPIVQAPHAPHAPHPPITPYSSLRTPQLQVPQYPQSAQYQGQSPRTPIAPSFTPQQPQAQGWQPYQPPATNYSAFQPRSANTGPATPYQRPQTRDNARHNTHNGGYHGRNRERGSGGRNAANKDGATKQPQQPAGENTTSRLPSPPNFFPRNHISKNKFNGPKHSQKVDSPIAAVKENNDPVKTTSDASVEKGKNILGSKYYDSEGKPIPREEVEGDEDAKKDPVWNSVRSEGGTTRADLSGETCTINEEDEELIKKLKASTQGEKTSANGSGTTENAKPDTQKKEGGGKKRNWDDFLGGKQNPGQEQQQGGRPNKRRYGHEGRNRRNNRQRRGGGGGGGHGADHRAHNKNTSQDTQMAGTAKNESQPPPAPAPPVTRSVHPLPPKPTVGPPPPAPAPSEI
ncbi:hypothetical protein BZA77DRAFT_121915 [Pyronema omphalodes]|nr:hypothetical protein BZA77DRAFT_121915 [Pyronema omphalodes]